MPQRPLIPWRIDSIREKSISFLWQGIVVVEWPDWSRVVDYASMMAGWQLDL